MGWPGAPAPTRVLVVTLAIVTAIFAGGGSALVTQAASSAVLVATLTPLATSGTRATGVDGKEANRLVRRAVGRYIPPNRR